ncbi:MAG: VWA domain-containing protein [Polyangiaceae bacterium]|nr:VWA domain-containing protein [Polyangiaceae bacterium]
MARWYLLGLPFLLGVGLFACGSSSAEDGGGPGPGGGAGAGGFPPDGGIGSGGAGASGQVTTEAAPLDPDVKLKPSASSPPTGASACAGFDNGSQLTVAVADAHGMASGPRIRELLAKGTPGPAAVRRDEITNYFRLDWPKAPVAGGFFARVGLRPRTVDGTVLPGHYDLLMAVRADPAVHTRKKVEMVVVLETSWALSEESLARGRKAVRALASSMLPGDHFTLRDVAGTEALSVELSDPKTELAGVEDLLVRETGESTRMAVEKALTKLQTTPADPAVWKRAVLVSNGGASDSPDLSVVETAAKGPHRIFFSAVGLGGDAYNGALLGALSRAGRGAHLYADSETEPSKLIEPRFDELFGLAAEDVRFSVKLPWFVKSSDPKAPDAADPAPPQHLSPGGTMMQVSHLLMCDTALAGAAETLDVSVSYTLPGTGTAATLPLKLGQLSTEVTLPVPELDELGAIDAWVAAFRAPSASRYALASQLLAAGALQGKAPFDELKTLLALHPNAP